MFKGERLKELRKKYGYSREKLAELLNIGESNIPRYERGENTPSGDTVAKMAQILNVSSDYLLGLSETPSLNHDDELSTKEQQILNALRYGDRMDAIKLITEFD